MHTIEDSLAYHRRARGKIMCSLTEALETRADLALSYTPGVAAPARAIANQQEEVWNLTGRGNRIAVMSDGSAVLGLGNVGPEAALPVMEGKAALFKAFANIDAFPIVLGTQDPDAIINIVEALAPSFGGINLEDISAPRCFEIEDELRRRLNIPVFHDDQHGTAIVVLAALMNALTVQNGPVGSPYMATLRGNIKIVISGAGAAGTAIARMLLRSNFHHLIVCDSKGIIGRNRDDLNAAHKMFLAVATNPENRNGTLKEAMEGADVFIGVSRHGLVTQAMIRSMAKNPIVFSLANPDPEIHPEEAKAAGASIIASGRSDFPNQVNNVLAFPGIFRGALDARAPAITEKMEMAAVKALMECVPEPTAEKILPDLFDRTVVPAIAKAVSVATATTSK